jgi:hypothetical protein
MSGVLMIGLFAGCGSDGKDKAAGPGPTKVVAGVPVGYERSKDGAARAALGYEATLSTLRQSSAEARRDALKVIAVPARQAEVVKAGESAYAFFDKQFGPEGVVRSAVVGYRVKSYDRDSAEVELWEVSVAGRPETVPARSGWSTRTVRLRWVDADWKVAELPSESSGPTPELQGAASDPADVIEAARQLEEVRYVPAE